MINNKINWTRKVDKIWIFIKSAYNVSQCCQINQCSYTSAQAIIK